MSSFEFYFINRTEAEPVTFEGTFSQSWTERLVAELAQQDFKVELIGDGGTESFIRVTLVEHPDGRPWIYQEMYAVSRSDA